MKPVYITSTAALTALGNSLPEQWEAISQGRTALQSLELEGIPFYGSRLQHFWESNINGATYFEKICVAVCEQVLAQHPMVTERTAFILSTTKGNISQLSDWSDDELALPVTASAISNKLGLFAAPRVISQACISGVMALAYAQYLLQQDQYDHVLVCGADVLSQFVLKGFQSFQAVANAACRPFDKDRSGINVGEAAAAILLSKNDVSGEGIMICGTGSSNDANHISGPSRTGEELAKAITQAMEMAQIGAEEIDMISAHGTATLYNDEMEACALHLCGFNSTPVHSFKSFVGHTFGAAGILELVMCVEAIRHQQLIPSLHYQTHGVSVPLNVTTHAIEAPLKTVLKTASGFGGVNAALILQKQ